MGRISKADLEKKAVEEVKVEETVAEEVVENKKEEKKIVSKTKSRTKALKEKNAEIKKNSSEIQVEILNISDANAYYVSRTGIVYFDLEPSEDVLLTLDEIEEVMRTAKSFFKNDVLVITNVYSDTYNLTDIMSYLKLRDTTIVGYDYMEEFIINSTDEEFKAKLERENINFVKRIACKCIYLDSIEEYILPRSKETIICNLLNISLLIGENER